MKLSKASWVAVVALAGCGTVYTVSPSATTPPPTATATGTSSVACDAELWDHVYHPDRLKVVDKCKTVSGTVESVRYEADGDTHIRLRVADPSLVNQSNIEHQHGDLVLEQICQRRVTQEDAIDSCKGVPHNQDIPHVGDHVTVTGSYVLDQAHGWMEIHPVTSLQEEK